MNKFLTVLKISLLTVLLVGLAFGYLFFRVWQKNERPELVSQSWSSSEVLLGHTVTLNLVIEAPWHREIDQAKPFALPDFLAPVPGQATVSQGPLSLDGTRTWNLVVPFVATDTKSLEGLTASFPVKPTKRISPNSIKAVLPPLKILTPKDIPETPGGTDEFLTDEKPPEEPKNEPVPPEPSRTWPWILVGLLVLVPLLIFLLKRTGVIKTTPPWEKALGNLAKLNPGDDPVSFYSKLTDILKQYISERYQVRARSKTSSEFLSILLNHPQVPKGQLDRLDAFARLSDDVKFADHSPDPTEAPRFLELIRSFVKDTTPDEEEEKKKS